MRLVRAIYIKQEQQQLQSRIPNSNPLLPPLPLPHCVAIWQPLSTQRTAKQTSNQTQAEASLSFYLTADCCRLCDKCATAFCLYFIEVASPPVSIPSSKMYLCSVLCPCPVASLVLKVLKQHFGSGINANECAVSLGIFAFYLRFACGIHKQEKWQQQQQQQREVIFVCALRSFYFLCTSYIFNRAFETSLVRAARERNMNG